LPAGLLYVPPRGPVFPTLTVRRNISGLEASGAKEGAWTHSMSCFRSCWKCHRKAGKPCLAGPTSSNWLLGRRLGGRPEGVAAWTSPLEASSLDHQQTGIRTLNEIKGNCARSASCASQSRCIELCAGGIRRCWVDRQGAYSFTRQAVTRSDRAHISRLSSVGIRMAGYRARCWVKAGSGLFIVLNPFINP